MDHQYTSTACQHDVCGSCRDTCKFCAARCGHSCHTGGDVKTVSPVDEARDVARWLLRFAGSELGAADATRVATDPALFWLRGEEQPPPGVWHG